MQQWKLNVEREQEALKIAKNLKAEGMDEKFIKKMTGLYLDKIRRL